MIWIKHTLLLISLLLISACGYHLRGSIDLPEGLKAIYLQNSSNQLRKSFKQTLKYIDGKLVETQKESGITIQVVKEHLENRVLSLSNTGRINEVELVYSLHFMMLNKKGKPLKEKQEITIRRDYFNDQGDVLAKNNEDQTIRAEMYDQAVQSIIQRARVALKNK
jgi:LPS-assembly lipoprotein